ncbi:hypothetical protein Dda_5628 [Drechslerella dactyloides]|uniref:Uncharacterized protein n=1 Tax=Drechslerella dactyloides TaxID=74499 RepID=A0AAD6IXV0_DREDA|nr:hypothetical protein Dda_5628 [Drechslerella dactyloides]
MRSTDVSGSSETRPRLNIIEASKDESIAGLEENYGVNTTFQQSTSKHHDEVTKMQHKNKQIKTEPVNRRRMDRLKDMSAQIGQIMIKLR